LFLEDNTITVYGCANSSASGARWCWRHNTFNLTEFASPVHDLHGNVGGRPGGMGIEIYENTYNVNNYGAKIVDQRGGKAVIFNNTINNARTNNTYLQIREEYLDSLEKPATSPNGQPQHVSSSYYWNNIQDETDITGTYVPETLLYPGLGRIVPLENVDFWNQKKNFDGTSGIGVGLLADRPATGVPGVGYWATDIKKLFRWTLKDGWEEYYTPYSYPHPLREILKDTAQIPAS
jgi:hypothetical protein